MVKLPGLPTSIKIGHTVLKVKRMTDKESHYGEMRGKYEPYKQTILVWEDLLPSDAAETMLHEILHACWRNVSLTGDVEENAVSVLAEGLAQVIRDNPDVVKCLVKFLK